MPLCSLHLVRLRRGKHASKSTRSPEAAAEIHETRKAFLQQLIQAQDLNDRLVVACVVRRPVIVANRIDHVYLNSTPWDLLLMFKGDGASKSGSSSSSSSSSDDSSSMLGLQRHGATRDAITAEYSISVGIPSRILDNYSKRSKELKEEGIQARQGKSDVSPSTSVLSNDALQQDPARTWGSFAPKTSQNLEMSPDLVQLIDELDVLAENDGLVDAHGPVQQLNLLAFKKTKEDKERYYRYGQGFGPIARKFGGEPKLLGLVVTSASSAPTRIWWDEVSLVNYHSLRHFAGMAASKEYQDINRTYRLPSLDDTTIVCTQEVELDAFRRRFKLPSQSGAKL